MVKKKVIIVYNQDSPGPTEFFDVETNQSLQPEVVHELIDSGVAELKIGTIEYVILLDTTTKTYYDTVKDCFITEKEAQSLVNSGKAVLKLKIGKKCDTQTENQTKGKMVKICRTDDEKKKDNLKEKVLLGAAAAGGTATVAAGAAAVPFVAGFTSGGVALGSIAAAIQSSIGSVAAGSMFATLQSIAATTIIGTCAPLVIAGTAAGGTVLAVGLLYRHARERRRKEREESYDRPPSSEPLDEPPAYSPI